MDNANETIVRYGGECKSTGEGKFAGYLVVFGTPDKTDLAGDYFTADTDFGLETGTKSRVYFDHCLDPTLKHLCIGEGTLTKDAKGIWLEGQLQARDGYSKQVKEIIGKDIPSLIAGKKLGLSSGTAAHLVQKEKVGDAFEIKSWPLGLDASLTATPCEPRTMAVPLKSWIPSAAKGVHLGPRAEVGAAMSAVEHLHHRLHNATWDALGDEKSTPKARVKKISDAFDECKSLCMKSIKALLGSDEEPAKDATKSLAGETDLEAEVLAFEADLILYR